MSTLISKVNKTQVNYETPFIYTFNLGVSELDNDIDNIKLVTLIPDYIDIVLPIAQNKDETITLEEEKEQKRLTIEIDNIDGKAISRVYKLECKFKYIDKKPPYTSYTNTTDLYIDNKLSDTVTAETVNLVIEPNFTLLKTKVVPISNPAPGEAVIWEIRLQNIGDKGGTISNVVINDIMPDSLILRPDYPITGYDISDNQFADNSADGLTGEYNENSVTFTIPPDITYGGTDYVFYIIAEVRESVEINTQILNSVNWTVNGESRSPAYDTITIAEATEELELLVSGPNYAVEGQNINYSYNILNSGNSDINNLNIDVTLPEDVRPETFRTGLMGIDEFGWRPSISYEINYETINGQSGSLGKYSLDKNSEIDLTTLPIKEGDYVNRLTMTLDSLPLGVSTLENPNFDVTVIDTPATEELVMDVNMTWDNGNIIDYKYTTLSKDTELKPENKTIDEPLIIQPGSTIRYGMRISAENSRVVEPIVVDLLPEGLVYDGNARYIYYDYWNDTTMDTATPTTRATFPTPTAEVIDNYKDTNRQLVRFSFTEENSFTLNHKDYLELEYDTVVKDATNREISNSLYLGNNGNLAVVSDGINNYRDELDLDGDGITEEDIAIFRTESRQISSLPMMEMKLEVLQIDGEDYTGPQDTIIPLDRNSTITYRMRITNNGQSDLDNLDIVNILPFPDDTSVIDDSVPRGSEYNMYLTKDITTEVTPIIEGEDAEFAILYSTSTNPTRFNTGSVNDWTTEKPEENEIRAFRIVKNNTPLRVGQNLDITYTLTTPRRVEYGSTAYSSYGAQATYVDDSSTITLVPAEPTRSGVRLTRAPQIISISGYIFNDANKNGIFDINEKGVNGIQVGLYNSDGQLVSSTTSKSSAFGQTGYYNFVNLEPDTYRVMVVLRSGIYRIADQVVDRSVRGSRVDKETGISIPIVITEENTVNDMYIGLIANGASTLLAVNESAKHLVRGALMSQITLEMKLVDTIEMPD